jgi:probable HAF family extracellular repeat protein
VIPLNPRGETYGVVDPKGINANGWVVGYNVDPEPDGARAFMYDGTHLFELGSFGGPYSAASAINRCGHATGWAQTANGTPHAFLYDGTLHDLGPGAGVAINDCGTITGQAAVAGDGFVYDGTLRPIGTFAGGTTSAPVDINAHGQVTGTGDLAGGAYHAFLYDSKAGTGLEDLGTLGGANSIPRAINDAGQVAGWSHNMAGRLIAFRYAGGVMQDLGTYYTGGTSEAVDINAAGQVVGNSFKADNSETRGFFHDGTTRHDLGQYSQLTAVNAGGQAVGFYYGPGPRALLWTLADGIVDLNTRLYAPPAGLRVTYAMAISDNGAIVARANTGLVLLKPRP